MFLSITFRPENSGPLIATQSFERISLTLARPSLLTGGPFFLGNAVRDDDRPSVTLLSAHEISLAPGRIESTPVRANRFERGILQS